MQWFRANLRSGSWLALTALAIQAVLAFGHFHAADGRDRIASPDLAAIQTLHRDDKPAIASADPADDRGDPGDDRHHAVAPCEICAIVAMAHAALPASPPALALPPLGDRSNQAAATAALRLGEARGGFQPRAPPLS